MATLPPGAGVYVAYVMHKQLSNKQPAPRKQPAPSNQWPPIMEMKFNPSRYYTPELTAEEVAAKEELAKEKEKKDAAALAEEIAAFVPFKKKVEVTEYTGCINICCCCIPVPWYAHVVVGDLGDHKGYPVTEFPNENPTRCCCVLFPHWCGADLQLPDNPEICCPGPMFMCRTKSYIREFDCFEFRK